MLFKLRIYFQANHASFTRASSVHSKQFKFNANTCSGKAFENSEKGGGQGKWGTNRWDFRHCGCNYSVYCKYATRPCT